ncbi:MAG: hypothetical protein WAN87_03325 [Thermoplasmata archaeon]
MSAQGRPRRSQGISVSERESSPTRSPVNWVQVAQALVAREMVESFGLPERHAAERLGIVPSSVSQYLSGKRLGSTLARYLDNERARRIARLTAQRLMEVPPSVDSTTALLEGALRLVALFGPRGIRRGEITAIGAQGPRDRSIPRWLKNRIAGEQSAVAECMRLAQKSRDELTRALFRQIASDSLRHAEIVASLAAYLDRGISSSVPTGISRQDVERLIEREHAAEAQQEGNIANDLGGVMRILYDSMESDERKHDQLLQQLLVQTAGRHARRRRTAS